MDAIALECMHCKAKLKIKASSARTPLEVKCPKCGKMIPIQKNVADSSTVPAKSAPPAAAPTLVAPPPPPVAPPPPPVAPPPPPVAPPPVAPVVAAPAAPKAAQPVSAPAEPAPKKAAAPIVLNTGGEQAALTIPVKCPSCHWQTKVAAPLIGKKIRCKQCGAITPVEAPDGYIPPSPALPASPPAPVTVSPATPAPVAIPPAASVPPPAPVPVVKPVAPPAPIDPIATAVAPPPQPACTPPPVLDPPPPKPVIPISAPPAAVKPKTDSGQVTLASIALQNEITELKAQLQAAHHQVDEAVRKTQTAAQRTADAERISNEATQRVREAEKMLHDMAGQKALETMATNRKVTELEDKVLAMQQMLSSFAQDYQAELANMETRAAAMRSKLSILGAR